MLQRGDSVHPRSACERKQLQRMALQILTSASAGLFDSCPNDSVLPLCNSHVGGRTEVFLITTHDKLGKGLDPLAVVKRQPLSVFHCICLAYLENVFILVYFFVVIKLQ